MKPATKAKPAARPKSGPAPRSPVMIELDDLTAGFLASDLEAMLEGVDEEIRKGRLHEVARMLDSIRTVVAKLIDYRRGQSAQKGGAR